MPSFVNRQECMDMIDASEVCIPTLPLKPNEVQGQMQNAWPSHLEGLW
jgi:hypothetical protein